MSLKIKNLKEILKYEGIPFEASAKLEDLQALVLNIQEMKTQKGCKNPKTVSDIDMKSPLSVKNMTSTKRISGTPTASTDYTPDEKIKVILFFPPPPPKKKNSIKKNITNMLKM